MREVALPHPSASDIAPGRALPFTQPLTLPQDPGQPSGLISPPLLGPVGEENVDIPVAKLAAFRCQPSIALAGRRQRGE